MPFPHEPVTAPGADEIPFDSGTTDDRIARLIASVKMTLQLTSTPRHLVLDEIFTWQADLWFRIQMRRALSPPAPVEPGTYEALVTLHMSGAFE